MIAREVGWSEDTVPAAARQAVEELSALVRDAKALTAWAEDVRMAVIAVEGALAPLSAVNWSSGPPVKRWFESAEEATRAFTTLGEKGQALHVALSGSGYFA